MHHLDISAVQAQILTAFAAHVEATGRSPTVREIGVALGMTSTAHVTYHLQRLIAKGYLSRTPRVSRGLTLLRAPSDLLSVPFAPPPGIPILGDIAAGSPLDIAETGEVLAAVNPTQYPPATYALRVRGDSMIEDHILDGDYVLIDPKQEPTNRAVIVATHLTVGERGAATLKRLHRTKMGIQLRPANARYAPLHIPRVEWKREWRVQGTVVGILRIG